MIKIYSVHIVKIIQILPILVDDDSIGLRPTMINLLGRHENLMRYICKLVDTAFRIHNSKRERAKEAMVCESLKRCLSHIYPSVRCHIFGSRRTGLTLKSSDLDVFVDCGKN